MEQQDPRSESNSGQTDRRSNEGADMLREVQTLKEQIASLTRALPGYQEPKPVLQHFRLGSGDPYFAAPQSEGQYLQTSHLQPSAPQIAHDTYPSPYQPQYEFSRYAASSRPFPPTNAPPYHTLRPSHDQNLQQQVRGHFPRTQSFGDPNLQDGNTGNQNSSTEVLEKVKIHEYAPAPSEAVYGASMTDNVTTAMLLAAAKAAREETEAKFAKEIEKLKAEFANQLKGKEPETNGVSDAVNGSGNTDSSEHVLGSGPPPGDSSHGNATEDTRVNGKPRADGSHKTLDDGPGGDEMGVQSGEEKRMNESDKADARCTSGKNAEEDDADEDDDDEDDADSVLAEEKASHIRTMINRWNDHKSKWEEIETVFGDNKEKSDKAATYRRYMDVDSEKKIDYEEIEIHDPEVKHLLAETDIFWQDTVKENSQQVVLSITPFYPFVWGWDKYADASEPKEGDSHERKKAREVLKELMQLVKISKGLESHFRSRDLIKSSKKIKFDDLWTLFAHGSCVYARSYGNDLQMFEVKECSSPPYSGRFRVSCAAFDWDGSSFSTYIYDFYIKAFHGDKLISSLDVFPTEFYLDQQGEYNDTQLKAKLVERGRKYYELCTNGPCQCKYDGAALVSPTGPHRLTSKGRGTSTASLDTEGVDVTSIDLSGSQSRVIVDNYAFMKSERNPMNREENPPLGRKVPLVEPDCICPKCKFSPLRQWRPDSGEKFSAVPARLMCLPPRLLGFALRDKVWGQFLVEKLTRIDHDTDNEEHMQPFKEELQLARESKEQLMALVQNHKATSMRRHGENSTGIDSKSFDVIDGKGQGLAILLHGPPGVGKTLTAETIAIATGRPLLTVSVAEIGTQAHEAESKMTDVFEDAARWGAVLLMDEADVFVEERVRGELQQNAFVSVLLRCLEYYDGIIILTTNRAKAIDGAVQSRIHLAIQYYDLKPDQRLAIYRNRLRVIPDSELEDRESLEKQLESSPLAKKGSKVNGRQIRNIVTGARMLALSKGQKLSMDHLTTVHDTTSDFISSMADLMQKQRARNELD